MNRVLYVTVVVRVLLRLIVGFGVGKYLRNSCHLAAKFGTFLRVLIMRERGRLFTINERILRW
jgi:hypothetical protein